MKVKCIRVGEYSQNKTLTVGKVYDILESRTTWDKKVDLYYLVDNTGFPNLYDQTKFEVIVESEVNENK
jgi:hypothetical protein